ncbi:MAG: flavodoxin family protein [Methanospirillum sp.]|uniref:flavodoxin family protein n=1 Tax=Methanospirillum sp. TaxID=45200 RepID=UPI00236A9731|nr:flavodoxin family protein [Methanospirillum sp.]MDD1729607.1 flavodoxin family protein [Methanospirillum sp.]
MKPQIVALLGSPLPEGNTAKLLKKSVSGAEAAGCDVQVIRVTELSLSGCMEHYFCRDHETCMMEDDVSMLYPVFREMDSLIIATPVMTMGIPGHLKSFIDRFQVFFCAKYVRNDRLVRKEKRKIRRTLLLSISGMNLPENFDGVTLSTRSFCDVIDCRYDDELLIRDMDNKVDLDRFPDLLETAYQKGFRLGGLLTGLYQDPV